MIQTNSGSTENLQKESAGHISHQGSEASKKWELDRRSISRCLGEESGC